MTKKKSEKLMLGFNDAGRKELSRRFGILALVIILLPIALIILFFIMVVVLSWAA